MYEKKSNPIREKEENELDKIPCVGYNKNKFVRKLTVL
jgi:hypothetical protein